MISNTEAGDRLIHRWTSVLKAMNCRAIQVISFSIYPRGHVPVQAVAHQF